MRLKKLQNGHPVIAVGSRKFGWLIVMIYTLSLDMSFGMK
jgi:hypothetical protein